MHALYRWAAVIVLSVLAPAAADWPRFRGPTGDGVGGDTGLPVKWGPKENVLWKTRLPGPGSSSPIVAGDRLYVTCYSGYGAGKGGDVKDLRRHLLCLDAKTGTVAWQKDLPVELPENDYNRYIQEHGYASATPAT